MQTDKMQIAASRSAPADARAQPLKQGLKTSQLPQFGTTCGKSNSWSRAVPSAAQQIAENSVFGAQQLKGYLTSKNLRIAEAMP